GHCYQLRITTITTVSDHVVLPTKIVLPAETGRAMPARHTRLDHHFIASLHPRYKLSDFSHDSGHIVSQNMRERNLNPRHTVANKNVEVVQRARFDFNQHFVRTDPRLGHVRVLEHFRSAMLSEDRGFHFVACSRAWYEERVSALDST